MLSCRPACNFSHDGQTAGACGDTPARDMIPHLKKRYLVDIFQFSFDHLKYILASPDGQRPVARGKEQSNSKRELDNGMICNKEVRKTVIPAEHFQKPLRFPGFDHFSGSVFSSPSHFALTYCVGSIPYFSRKQRLKYFGVLKPTI